MKANLLSGDTTLLGGREQSEGRVMTETADGGGRAEVERRIIEKSLADEVFRQRLLEDPRLLWSRSSEPGCPKAFG